MRPQDSTIALTIRGVLAPLRQALSVRLTLALLLAVSIPLVVYAQAPTPGQNVNMVSGTNWPGGDPFLRQQNEPSIAVSTRNPQHLLAGANDYRTVDLPLVDQLPINQLNGDAWLGVFKSFDGGQRWQSTLLPGFPQDQSPFGASSPMKGFGAASDPTVRAGTNGMFYYSGIALNRNTNIGGLFIARLIDLNNKENGDATQSCTPGQPCSPAPTTDPIRYINTVEIDAGNAGQFIDKPWIAVDIPRAGALNCTIQTTQQTGVDSNGNPITAPVTQTFPGGNVYIAYAMFVGGAINVRSKINFSKSSDCGATWTKPIMISQTFDINQGTQIAVDPETGYVYVAWRVFSGSGSDPDAIVITKSTDFGNTFTKAVPVRTLTTYTGSAGSAMFDQNTSATEFRDQTMPTLAVDDSGRVGVPGNVYVAWAERGVGPSGDARIRISTSSDGVTWPSTQTTNVDNNALTDDSGNLINGGRGHQLMPAMTFIGGKLMIMYYDLRLDATTGVFTPTVNFQPDSKGQFFEESRPDVGDPLKSVFTPFIDDNGLMVRRHTMDVMVAESNGGLNPSFTTARLSRYDFGLPGLNDFSLGPQQLEQLKLNPPNLPMFAGGTVPFMGDYVDIAGQEFVTCAPVSSACPNGWTFNNPVPSNVAAASAATKPPASSPIYFGTWTTNQDVIPPFDGDWTKYTAPPMSSQTTSFYNGQPLPQCLPADEGDRNQNIYESRITQGLYVSAPQNSKPLSETLQRAFVILVQNSTTAQRGFQLSIAPPQPPGDLAISGQNILGGYASFQQAVPNQPSLPSPLPTPVTTALVTISAHSGATRTVFALSNNPTASITVNVSEIQIDINGNPVVDVNGNPSLVSGGLSSFIVLNADGTVPTLVNADGVPTNTSIGGVEIYTPSIGHPTVVSPSIGHPSIGHPSIGHPDVGSPSIGHPGVQAPSIGHPGVPNASVTDGAVVANTSLADPLITACSAGTDPNTCVADARYTLTNDGGNTTAAFTVQLTGGTTLNVPLQLAVIQTYTTQTADPTQTTCALSPQQQDITNTNVNNPSIGHPSIGHPAPTDATILLAPGDSAQIILRGKTDTTTMGTIITQVAPLVVPQAINTNSTATTPPVIAPLFITTASLPDGVVPVEGTTTFGNLNAIGGDLSPACVGTWTLIGAPAGLSLSSPASFTPGNLGVSSVTLSGNPVPGTYTFTAQVQDCGPASIATRQFTLRVAAPLVITAPTLPTAAQGISYGPVNFAATGGIGTYTWTVSNGSLDGLTLSSSGVLSGTPTATGTFPFTAQVTDSASPSQTASISMTLNVVPATAGPATGTLMCDTFNFATVTQGPNGPPNPTTCTLATATKITQLATYHYNGGNGAAPGTISIRRQDGLTFGPYTATGVAGQNGPNEAWVANPNVIVTAGTYTIIDSDPATWSFNSGSNNAGFVRLWGFAVGVPTFTATQTGPTQWTYTLTFAPLVNYSVFPVATSSTNQTTITLTGLVGVTSAAGPTSTDFPATGIPDLNAVNLNWSAAVLNNGTTVVFTHVGPGTGNFNVDKHAFGFTITTSGAGNGMASLVTSGFSRDTTNALPDGTFNLDITDTTNGPTVPPIIP